MEIGNSLLQELRKANTAQVSEYARKGFETAVVHIEEIGHVAEEQYQNELREMQKYPASLRKRFEESAQVSYEKKMYFMRELIRNLATEMNKVINR